MGIDFITLIAQIINLMILIWLLKKFLYKPIMQSIEQRQALIEDEIKKAKKATREAMNEEEAYQKRLVEFDNQRAAMIAEVKTQTDNLRENLIKEAHQNVQQTKQRWKTELSQEQQTFEDTLQTAIIENFKSFASDALNDMADADLSELILTKFKKQLQKLSQSKQKKFYDAIVLSPTLIIATALKISATQKRELEKFLIQTFHLSQIEELKFKYTQNKTLICGIEISIGEQMISWSLQSYLDTFKNNVDTAFNELAHQEG